jgi:hypothetical protein
MLIQARPPITIPELIAPFGVAAVAVLLAGLLREPARRNVSAILLAGAGAAYLGGGLGVFEVVFCIAMTFVAYFGLGDYRWIGVGWLMHSGADVAHHLWGNPILPMLPLSSFGCALCDVGLAAWYFAGAPSPFPWTRATATNSLA